MTRGDVADFLSTLIFVYTLLVIAWVVVSLVFAFGVRVPYARWSSAVLDFLRDVVEPYLRIFRRFVPQIGPLDLSPMVAILALQIVGSIVVALIRG